MSALGYTGQVETQGAQVTQPVGGRLESQLSSRIEWFSNGARFAVRQCEGRTGFPLLVPD